MMIFEGRVSDNGLCGQVVMVVYASKGIMGMYVWGEGNGYIFYTYIYIGIYIYTHTLCNMQPYSKFSK